MNKNLLKTFLVAVGLAAGTMGTWAQSEPIYERGISTNWSENDLSDWSAVTAGTTFEISDGLKTGGGNGSYEYSKTISTTENSKITINATWNTGSSTGRNGSYNYLSFGDIQFRAYGQDMKATVAFGGDETVLSTSKNDVRYDAEWNILLTINKATGEVTYDVKLNSGTQNGSCTHFGTYENIKLGFYRSGRVASTYQTLKSISVAEEKQTVSTANYTVKFVDQSNNEIKQSETRAGAIGTEISLIDTDVENFFIEDKKYIFEKSDVEGKTVSEDGKTIVTVYFREARDFKYTINSKVNDEVTVIATGSGLELETVKIPYKKYIEKDGVLYEAAANNKEYNYSLTLDQDNKVGEITYNRTDIANVVFLKEAESIDGMTVTEAGNANIRCSDSKGAYNAGEEPVLVTRLLPGKYKITAQVWGNEDADDGFILINYGEAVDWKILTKGYILSESREIVLNKATDITLPKSGTSGGKCLDYIFIQKMSDIVSIAYSDGLATYTPAYDLDFTNAKNIAAYTATISGDKVNLTRVNTVAAGEGVLIRSLNGGATEEEIPVAAETVEKTADNMFVGTLTDIDALATEGDGVANYILNDGDLGTGFYRANNQKVGAGKAYLSVPAASAAKISFFSLDGTVTAIEGVEAEAAEGDKVFYNLSGQRVENPAKGLYIVNGKKVIIK